MAGVPVGPEVAAESQRISRQPSTASAVASPPPASSAGGPVGASWPAYAASPLLEPGADFGPRYRIEERIGEGGMGTVYRAFDKELNRVVALKLLRPELTHDAGSMQRFKQELLLASKVSHKNILRIHDLGDAGGIRFISMAYVDGEDLNGLLGREGKLDVERAASIFRELCFALKAAHSEGIVHRDLKPHNVLLDKSGGVFVSDFGLAKSLESGNVGMTRTGEFLGTPRYMSPEQVEGQPVDQRSDIYALGLIVYEMLTGDVPFSGDSAMQVMFKRIKEKPKNPRSINPAIPEYLARIVLHCLERKPTDRYLQAGEILADLNAHRASSHGITMKFTIPAAADRRWWWIAGAAVLVIALGYGIWRFTRPPADATGSAPAGAAVPAGPVRYVAVLPFRILGDEKALGYLGEGLIEGLTAKLSQLPALRVSSRSAVEEARAKGSMDKIARALGVKLVVSGVIQPAGDRLRVIVNVDDMEKGQRVWGQEFTGIAQDLLALEDQIYAKVVPGLGLEATGEEIARATAHPTENLEAYDLYLRGRGALRGQQDVRKLEEAVANFEQALKKDPQFALAYAGLADAQMQLYTEKKDQVYAERALGAAQQAARLDDKLPEVHFSLGSVFSATGRTSEAIAELKRALTLAPNSDEGHRRLGHAFMRAGRTEEALQAFQKAIDVNPYFWLNHSALGGAHFQIGDNEKALAGFRKVTELEPDNPLGHENQGSVYFRQGKWNECIPFFEKALALEPYWSTYSNLGTAYFYLKRYPDAVRMFEKSVEMNPNEEVTLGNLADAYRWSGLKDKAQAKYDAAIARAYQELRVNPRDANTLGNLALYYAKKGDDSRGVEFIRRARSIDQTSVSLMYNEAVVHALGRRVPEAMRALRKAVGAGYSAAEAQNDPELESLRSHPDFAALGKAPR